VHGDGSAATAMLGLPGFVLLPCRSTTARSGCPVATWTETTDAIRARASLTDCPPAGAVLGGHRGDVVAVLATRRQASARARSWMTSGARSSSRAWATGATAMTRCSRSGGCCARHLRR